MAQLSSKEEAVEANIESLHKQLTESTILVANLHVENRADRAHRTNTKGSQQLSKSLVYHVYRFAHKCNISSSSAVLSQSSVFGHPTTTDTPRECDSLFDITRPDASWFADRLHQDTTTRHINTLRKQPKAELDATPRAQGDTRAKTRSKQSKQPTSRFGKVALHGCLSDESWRPGSQTFSVRPTGKYGKLLYVPQKNNWVPEGPPVGTVSMLARLPHVLKEIKPSNPGPQLREGGWTAGFVGSGKTTSPLEKQIGRSREHHHNTETNISKLQPKDTTSG